ncbi:ribosome biogenesis GTPase Der [Shewanella baltica]|uniref:GTPase Der n=1 Tax=Shewanella baltica (strain OS155 / ATCC BAA-1091) TaxID=325240 RepID=DER_SHEB5|nr:ribosome biogenesis GTPase Der [Shewanella baltica]A3D6V5.1 RecName: Full=GTPase Der; AltName: Full=GTP-binding protein EngA [Shewanella baltica OS155]ABN62468.1 small GTP-binding protein [Shewanella baltica OS155]AEH14813.1 ribosome-associated GTPase EngA [Shewanella baltica OS117]KZK70000.1 ribosome biogenesis GTPase Der [Shewanella baltica]MCS6204572.1 ribosome biogenesis GTPase Der [Shewanella baltica]MCS6229634.1 ribosome biogenesis GTPase Der [Shewanella baltica]
MIPVVALVGRPNVGKSTLFNRLTRTRDALVADFPGLTRDRKYGRAFLSGYEFIVVDTGGIDGTEEGIETKMAEQSLAAIEEADVVLFMTDARAGLTAADLSIAQHLRSREKTTFVVANKVDGIDADSACAEFWSLGLGEVYQMAASQGRGVTNMIEYALTPYAEAMGIVRQGEDEVTEEREYTEEEAEAEQKRLQDLPIKLAIIGKPNVGKSTLTNRILGEERVVVFDEPGTTRDSIYIPMEREGREYVIIDTAGVRRRSKVHQVIEKFSVIKTLKAVEDANVVLLIIDAREGIAEQDLGLLGFALNAGRALVIAVNKWDGIDQGIKDRVKSELDRRLGFIDFARIHFISALHGTGVGHLFESIEEAYDSATRRVSTSMLTRIMQMSQDDHQPPLVNGRRVKLKYAHAGGYNPPIVVIHGNQVSKLPDSYKRYMMNYFRRSLKVVGTPIQLRFQEGDNPFENKTEKLTMSQERRRKRAQSHIKDRKTK